MIILFLHIVLAISSVVLSSFLLFKPSKSKLNGVYVLFGGALLTGTILVLINSAHLLQACITGIIYTTVVVGALAIGKRKIAAIEVKKRDLR